MNRLKYWIFDRCVEVIQKQMGTYDVLKIQKHTYQYYHNKEKR
jgi:hypothetical protein